MRTEIRYRWDPKRLASSGDTIQDKISKKKKQQQLIKNMPCVLEFCLTSVR